MTEQGHDAFRQAIISEGLVPPTEFPPGKFLRFPGVGKTNGNTAGWAKLFANGEAGVFGDFSSGLEKTWFAHEGRTLTTTERNAHDRRMAELTQIRDAEMASAYAEAATVAAQIWTERTGLISDEAAQTHLYLRAKRVGAYGIREYTVPGDVLPSWGGSLVVPLRDATGTLWSLAFIRPDGEKRYLEYGKKQGQFHLIGTLTGTGTGTVLCIGEGYATAASVFQATGHPTAMACDAGNLALVARVLRATYPHATIVLCADHDRNQVGQKAAQAAAAACGGLVACPVTEGHDFNDLHVTEGLSAVNAVIEAALRLDSNRQGHSLPHGTAAHLHTPPALAQDPNILAKFEETVRVCGVVGEERCAKLVYLALTSRLLNEPVSLVIKGLSSSGKSHTTMRTVKFFPDTAVIAMTAMSSKALVYMKEEFSHRTLVLYEATALRESREKDDGDMTSYFIRSLLSEGRIVYPVTVRDKHDGFVTKTIVKEGPTNCIVTTASLSLHGENETRMLSIPTNDTQAQTKAVMVQVAQGAPPQAPDLRDWHALQGWLEQAEHRVVIPYALALAESIPPIAVRLRRDIKTLFRLIESHAMLHQASRTRDDLGRIVATMDDYLTVRALIVDLLASGVGATVPETLRTTVQVVAGGDQDTGVTVRAVAEQLKLDRSAAQRRLHGAREKGYLVNLEDKRGRPARYALGDPLPEDVELLPLALPGYERCAHTPTPEGTSPHSVSASEVTAIVDPVQVCAGSGEKESENSPVSDDADTLVIYADAEEPALAPRPDTSVYPSIRHWVEEREAIRLKKEAGHPGPWTDDAILAQNKFCNVCRKHDRVSRWILAHLIAPNPEAPFLLEWLALARWTNWPPTLQAILEAGHGPSVPPDWPAIGHLIEARGAAGAKRFGGAYNIPATAKRSHPWYKKPKARFICEGVLAPLFTSRDQILRLCEKGVRQHVHAFLVQHDFFESFLAGQVVDDWSWCPILAHATDLLTWAPLGPGSQRGLNRLAGRPLETKLFGAVAVREMVALRNRLIADLPWTEGLTLHDVQNCLCEADKYLRVLNSEGPMKATYRPETAYTV